MTSATFVPLAEKNAAIALEELLPQVLSAPPRQANFLQVCTLYRRGGIAGLLASGDPVPFWAALFNSSRAFLHFLEAAADPAKLTSRSAPFLDAVACRDLDGAAAISERSRTTPAPGKEYEEDFFYFRFLMERFFPGAAPARPEQRLKDWAALSPDDVRLSLCHALFRKDQDAFDGALEAAIASLQLQLAKARDQDALSPDDAATVAHVSTEVLAWLELAPNAGLQVGAEYPLAPGIARSFRGLQHPAPDAWKRVQSARAFERP